MARRNPAAYRPEVIERESRVVELRRAGATFDVIAQVVGYGSSAGAYKAFRRALDRTLVDSGTEECRELELLRLDRLQEALWTRAVGGDIPAIGSVLRIMDQRAKLLGLYAPLQTVVGVQQVDPVAVDAEVARLVALLASV